MQPAFEFQFKAPKNLEAATVALQGGTPGAIGETLFTKETFLGNGRTCATCHKPNDDFGLTAAAVALSCAW